MIELKDLEHGRIYQIQSRNLRFGAWNSIKGTYVGIRTKFHDRYLAEEYFYGETHGTARPLVATEHLTNDPVHGYWMNDQYRHNNALFEQLAAIESEAIDG